MKKYSMLFKVSAVLWIVWGLVHILAGVMINNFVLSGDITGAIAGIADAVDLSMLQMDYPEASGAILSQHGFNLFWIGIVTTVSAFYIWKGNRNAIYLAALTGGLTDLGYFLFLDLGGFVNFMPGTLMTIFSALAVVLSFYADRLKRKIA